ncbi:MAG: GMC family oxidoreductase [Acidimicrobiales bacterium]|jgi:choline dehydrogenase
MSSIAGQTWDIVVIGAGAAGAVIATRASEDPHRSVLLLDAGPDYPLAADLPADLVDGHDNSYVDHDWGLTYNPLGDRSDRFPRGRVTGGSTAVNTTIALRGIPADYDGWAELGNPAWAWDQVLPAFNRLERDLDYGDEPYHGDAGPISIRRWTEDELVPTQAAFIEAALQHGFPASDDVNAPDAVGVGPMAMNKLGRLRISTAIGYLASARYRANLTIRPDTLVNRVVVEHGRAVGVETDAGDRIGARLVVVSAGAVHTPGVLIRSGIGSADELASLGVEPVATMDGVGANLSDHPALAIVMSPKFPEFCTPDLPLVQTICRYTSERSNTPLDVNIELITRTSSRSGDPMFMLAPSLEQVDGRGAVRQTSLAPHSMPSIQAHFGENERDLARHVQALEDAFALTRLAPLREFIDQVHFPDPSRISRADLEQVARRVSASGYHPCGTAKMGPADDPLAVVDQFGRCHGVDQLVVADASIMPTVPRANINLSTIMIGEMMGEWLRTEPARYGL